MGHEISLGAIVVLPEGFDEHPNARYPVAYTRGTSSAPGTDSARRRRSRQLTGPRAATSAESHIGFFQDWVSGKLGRFIIVLMQHPTPFYDDSYAVNSRTTDPTATRSRRS